jgi:hypothetical protein
MENKFFVTAIFVLVATIMTTGQVALAGTDNHNNGGGHNYGDKNKSKDKGGHGHGDKHKKKWGHPKWHPKHHPKWHPKHHPKWHPKHHPRHPIKHCYISWDHGHKHKHCKYIWRR